MTLSPFFDVLNRLKTGLLTLPKRAHVPFIALTCASYFMCAWAIGFGAGLYRFEPNINADLWRVALIAFFVPAIGEELFFRGVLIPSSVNHPGFTWHSVGALVAFLAWHPLNAFLFFPSALPLFSDWRFLTVTAFLGLACSEMWRRTGSLWPAIILHWVVVIVWKAFLGAPRML